MKKITLISSMLLSLASFSASAADQHRIGVGAAWDYGFGVTAQFNSNINATVGNDGFGLDYIFVQEDIQEVDKLTWFIAAGGGMLNLFDSNDNTAIKARGLAGLDFNFAPDFDAYLAVGPDIKLYTDSNVQDRIKFGLDALLGIRYFF